MQIHLKDFELTNLSGSYCWHVCWTLACLLESVETPERFCIAHVLSLDSLTVAQIRLELKAKRRSGSTEPSIRSLTHYIDSTSSQEG